MINDVLRLTGEYLAVTGTWLVLVAVFVWNWLVLGLLWLVVGGVVSLPLFVRLGKLMDTYIKWFPWVMVFLVTWFYAHLWVASAVWFNANIAGVRPGTELIGIWTFVCMLIILWSVGLLCMWKWATS